MRGGIFKSPKEFLRGTVGLVLAEAAAEMPGTAVDRPNEADWGDPGALADDRPIALGGMRLGDATGVSGEKATVGTDNEGMAGGTADCCSSMGGRSSSIEGLT